MVSYSGFKIPAGDYSNFSSNQESTELSHITVSYYGIKIPQGLIEL